MGFFSPSFFVILKQKSISRAYIQDLTCQRSLLGCVMMTLSWHLSSFLLLFLCAGKLLPDDLCLFLKHHCFCQPQNTSAHAEPHSWAGKLSLKLLFFLLTVICWTPFLIILELRFQFVLVFFSWTLCTLLLKCPFWGVGKNGKYHLYMHYVGLYK